MRRFALATLTNVALLALALIWGGFWPALALLYITAFAAMADRLLPTPAPEAQTAGTALPVVLGLVQTPLLLAGIAVLAGSAGAPLGPGQSLCLFVALALYLGQIGNANAHELIHRAPRWQRRLGALSYGVVLFGHHASAHLRVHHVHAATDLDPNSARRGESFWRFALRAWVGSFRAGWRAERRLGRRGLRHPYAGYAASALVTLVAAHALGGLRGVGWLIALALYAQLQLLLSDYVQHYGLRRAPLPSGRPEPMGPGHSWNAPHVFSSALMLNAPRHSDHHAAPTRSYPALRLTDGMPMLPQSLPVMAVVALCPPWWRRVMHPRLEALKDARPDTPPSDTN